MKFLAGLALSLFLTAYAVGSHGQTKPNIIVILADDMGFSDIGAFGGNFVPTPHLDKLAQEGTRMTQYYSAAPICSPSVTVKTGRGY